MSGNNKFLSCFISTLIIYSFGYGMERSVERPMEKPMERPAEEPSFFSSVRNSFAKPAQARSDAQTAVERAKNLPENQQAGHLEGLIQSTNEMRNQAVDKLNAAKAANGTIYKIKSFFGFTPEKTALNEHTAKMQVLVGALKEDHPWKTLAAGQSLQSREKLELPAPPAPPREPSVAEKIKTIEGVLESQRGDLSIIEKNIEALGADAKKVMDAESDKIVRQSSPKTPAEVEDIVNKAKIDFKITFVSHSMMRPIDEETIKNRFKELLKTKLFIAQQEKQKKAIEAVSGPTLPPRETKAPTAKRTIRAATPPPPPTSPKPVRAVPTK